MKSAPFVMLALSLIGLLLDSDISRISGALSALGMVYWIHCRDLRRAIERELSRSYGTADKIDNYPPRRNNESWDSRSTVNGYSFVRSTGSRSEDSSPVAITA